MNTLRKFLNDESGPTAVEYAVMLAMIVIACLAAILSVGQSTANSLDDSSSKLGDFLGN